MPRSRHMAVSQDKTIVRDDKARTLFVPATCTDRHVGIVVVLERQPRIDLPINMDIGRVCLLLVTMIKMINLSIALCMDQLPSRFNINGGLAEFLGYFSWTHRWVGGGRGLVHHVYHIPGNFDFLFQAGG